MTMDARQGGDAGARLFSRRLAVALLLGVLAAISAAFGATYWMAQKQDALAAKANVRMVSRGLDRFVETAKASLLDYSLWTAAFERLGADDRSWAYDNIGFSAIAGTFDAAVILPLGAADYGWSRGGPETPRPEVLDPAAVSTAQRLLADEPIDSGEAKVTFARSGGALWLLAIARVAPQAYVTLSSEIGCSSSSFQLITNTIAKIARTPSAASHHMYQTTPKPTRKATMPTYMGIGVGLGASIASSGPYFIPPCSLA